MQTFATQNCYTYGLIGNCQASALISQNGSIDWLCFPRPDSPPVFGRLIDPDGGAFSIETDVEASYGQKYLPNTNVLETTVNLADGSSFKITDFCPRFLQHGRSYRPNSLFRIVERITGSPAIRVRCTPVEGWSKKKAEVVRGNSHLRWEIRGDHLRLTTNMSLTYLCEERFFNIEDKLYFALSWGLGIEDDLARVSLSFFDQTVDYWRTWVKHCSIPPYYQSETIRSALALKLHCYEDTGAILAATTTSLPEECESGRNWDYRYCWLRDAYFVLSAFRNLGHFEEMEGFVKFLLNIAHRHEHSLERLHPVYALDQTLPLPEYEHPEWAGYLSSKPVRSNNQAAEHVQNDVYGEMILTLAPIFLDERFHHLRTPDHEALIASLARICAQKISEPDAGLWELRNGWQEHSFSNLMCWAGLDRAHRIQGRGFLNSIGIDLSAERSRAQAAIESAVYEGSLRNGPKDASFDAALLQLPILRYPDAQIGLATIDKIVQELSLPKPGFLYRYKRKDDFGMPQSAFIICSFWLVQAYASLGNISAASKVMKHACEAANELGLFSEHYHPEIGQQCGNFPQAYSHVGQINAAFSISPPWEQFL